MVCPLVVDGFIGELIGSIDCGVLACVLAKSWNFSLFTHVADRLPLSHNPCF